MSFHETTSIKCHWYLVRLWFLVLLWEFSSYIVLRIWEYHSLLVILRSSWYSKLVYKFGPLSFFSSLDCVQDGPMAACSPTKWQNTMVISIEGETVQFIHKKRSVAIFLLLWFHIWLWINLFLSLELAFLLGCIFLPSLPLKRWIWNFFCNCIYADPFSSKYTFFVPYFFTFVAIQLHNFSL